MERLKRNKNLGKINEKSACIVLLKQSHLWSYSPEQNLSYFEIKIFYQFLIIFSILNTLSI